MDAHPIDQLRQEHELIRMTIGAMEREIAAIERTGRVHGVRVARMVDFARHFTDGCHHHKEEDLLFPVLRERNASIDAAVGTLLAEHRMGREAVAAVDEALFDCARDVDSREVIAVNLSVYAGLLRVHIAKEEIVLFPIAERLLDDQEMELLAGEFDRFEEFETGHGEHARYEALARELARLSDTPDGAAGAGRRAA